MRVLSLIKYSLQMFDEAICELQQEDQGAHGGYFH